jgi:Yip1 domain
MSSPTSPTPQPAPYSSSANFEPTGQGLSETQRLVDAFIAPKKTFEDIRRNSSWWVPWLVTAVFSLTFGIIATQKLDMGHLIQREIDKSPSAQRRMEQVPAEQREGMLKAQAMVAKGFFYAAPVLNLIGGLIIAAILMVVFNFLLGAEVPFQRAMAVVFYSFVPLIISAILLIVSLLVSADPNSIDVTNPMPTNPGFFMDPMGNRFLYSLASSLDIFSIWVLCLLGLGFSTASSNRKPNTKTGIVTMFVVFGIFVLCRAAWKGAF